MASYGLPLSDIPGVRHTDDLKNPENARKMGAAMQKRMYRGDVATNLAATSLVANAYLFTGEQKYADWIKDYAGAWLDRTRANDGITPDNVGLSGKIGEYHSGKWWGGLYGWPWPHSYYSVGMALQIAGANGMLVSGGDPRYLEMARSTIDQLIPNGKTHNGPFLIPTKHNDSACFSFMPMFRSIPASLWFMTQAPPDCHRLHKPRPPTKLHWHKATGSSYPNNGY